MPSWIIVSVFLFWLLRGIHFYGNCVGSADCITLFHSLHVFIYVLFLTTGTATDPFLTYQTILYVTYYLDYVCRSSWSVATVCIVKCHSRYQYWCKQMMTKFQSALKTNKNKLRKRKKQVYAQVFRQQTNLKQATSAREKNMLLPTLHVWFWKYSSQLFQCISRVVSTGDVIVLYATRSVIHIW